MAIELALMAIDTKKAIKNSPKHLLGIQDLKVSEIKHILNEAKQFIDLNRSKNKKLDILKGINKQTFKKKFKKNYLYGDGKSGKRILDILIKSKISKIKYLNYL